MEVKERYVYAFNGSTPEEAIHMEARANGWTWMLRLRADLYITKFISAYSEFILSEPVGDVQLSSSATWHGETRSLPRSRKTHTEFLGFGVALHL